ncbi:hypothetical protein AAVH_19489 [Aphelenchoides avenae]|nr:hypothetical protein AAVH_19489 [Aphelenchus avenae]
MVFPTKSPGSQTSDNDARGGVATEMSDNSDVFTTGGKSECDGREESNVSGDIFDSPEKENNACAQAGQADSTTPQLRRILTEYSSDSDIEITGEVASRSGGSQPLRRLPEVEFIRVVKPGSQSETAKASTSVKQAYRGHDVQNNSKVPTGSSSRKANKRTMSSDSSSDGSIPRVRGTRAQPTAKPKDPFSAFSESDSEHGLQPPKRKQLKGPSGGARRSVVKGSSAKSINVAYSEGSGTADSDEWSNYTSYEIDKKLVDYRPTAKIPISKKLDYLEVVERKLDKAMKKSDAASTSFRGSKKQKTGSHGKPPLHGSAAKPKRPRAFEPKCCTCSTCQCSCHKPPKKSYDDSDDDGPTYFASGRRHYATKLFA